MLKKINLSSRLTFILKCLLISYLLTTGLLLLLALMLYRFGLSEKIVSICIIAIYIIITFLAGFLAGKREGNRKFLWGLMMGSLYFVILIVLSLIVNHGLSGVSGNLLTVLMLCGGSGMLGGMIS
ncbi:MAG: TIGR04086 family membrane protein [Lachnospiraceae bacterium]|nr:TIGR04086 family membrane protein [Lachnospiraceae bacterium]